MDIGYAGIVIAVSFGLSFLVESMVEYLLGTPFDKVEKLKPWKWALQYVAVLAGVGLAMYYRLDLVALIAVLGEKIGLIAVGLDQPTPVGMALSGMVIGRGANYLHDFVSRYLKPWQVGEGAK
jgi:hypothetical protein